MTATGARQCGKCISCSSYKCKMWLGLLDLGHANQSRVAHKLTLLIPIERNQDVTAIISYFILFVIRSGRAYKDIFHFPLDPYGHRRFWISWTKNTVVLGGGKVCVCDYCH